MSSIAEELRAEVAKLEDGIEELEAEVERLRVENARLQFCLNSRDDFLGSIGQWKAYIDALAGKES
jgi:predicted nuclease with TOPRIM domain